jgi:hypothetical protein
VRVLRGVLVEQRKRKLPLVQRPLRARQQIQLLGQRSSELRRGWGRRRWPLEARVRNAALSRGATGRCGNEVLAAVCARNVAVLPLLAARTTGVLSVGVGTVLAADTDVLGFAADSCGPAISGAAGSG